MSSLSNNDTTMSPHLVNAEQHMFVTMRMDRQLFGIPVKNVRDVLRSQKITTVPLAAKSVAGSINLRGRIITVINLRNCLGISSEHDSAKSMFVVVEHKNELYSLIVDSVGEVLTISQEMIEKVPTNLDPAWHRMTTGVYKLDGELLLIMDIAAMLHIEKSTQ